MEELNLNKIDDKTKEKAINFLEDIGHNEAYIVHFLNEADVQPDPVEFLKKKYPDMFEDN